MSLLVNIKNKDMKKVLFILTAAILLTSCFREKVDGNGHVTTQQYEVSNFDHVYTDGVFDVYIYQSEEYLVEIETDANIQDYIKVSIVNGKLMVNMQENTDIDATKLNIIIFAPEYKHISCDGVVNVQSKTVIYSDMLEVYHDGVGDINMSLSVSDLKVDCDGVGNITLNGEANNATIVNDGVGNIYSFGLEANEVSITNSGVGDAEVFVTGNLNAKVSGVGTVYYKGNPESVNSSVSGTGKLIAR